MDIERRLGPHVANGRWKRGEAIVVLKLRFYERRRAAHNLTLEADLVWRGETLQWRRLARQLRTPSIVSCLPF